MRELSMGNPDRLSNDVGPVIDMEAKRRIDAHVAAMREKGRKIPTAGGAVVYAERPQPVAWLTRHLGANRQNVQRIVNDLEAAGLVKFEMNPHHRRAQLVVLTEKGWEVFAAAMQLQVPWADRL